MMNSTYRYSSTSTSYSPILQASPRVSVHDSRSSSRHGSNTPHEHEEWFIEDEMVIFLVENCYVKIHKYFLQRDSQVFRDLFSCPCPPGSAEPEGKTKETAVVLPGVTKYEMSCLLKFLYHGMYDNHTTYPWRTSVAEWTALLSISTRYAFDRIRSRAIAALSPLSPTSTTSSYSTVTQLLDPVDMLVLAIKHDVLQWLEPAYVALCMREHPLEEEEGEKLGVGTCVRLAKVRERYWREQAGRLEEDVRLGSNAGSRRFSVLLGQPPCPKRARATQIVHEVFWPTGVPPAAAGVSEGGPMQI